MSYIKTIVSKILDDRHFDMLVERLKLRAHPKFYTEIELLDILGDPRAVEPILDHLMVDQNERLEFTYGPVLQRLDRAAAFKRLVTLVSDIVEKRL